MTGISNGGYLVRWQLENHPELYDGGVDWEGTLWRADGPNLFTYLPAALRNYTAWSRGDEAAHEAMLAAGFAPGSEFLWPYHYAESTGTSPSGSTARSSTPATTAPLEAGTPFCAAGHARPATPTTTTRAARRRCKAPSAASR